MDLLQKTKELLDSKVALYNNIAFIEHDPIQIPHLFSKHEDIEISGFLTATIAWGQRTTIINNAYRIVELMDRTPYDFIMNHKASDLKRFEKFCHRTFNYDDLLFFIDSLQHIYQQEGGFKRIFENAYSQTGSIYNTLDIFRAIFLSPTHFPRSDKHISSVAKGSAAKRLNMFLRWMVRDDSNGVDFGIWQGIPASALHIPLDVHSGNVARKLGLLKRTQNDWQAVLELTNILCTFAPEDPIKYDFALFGMGVNE